MELLRYRLSIYLSPFCKLCGKTILITLLNTVYHQRMEDMVVAISHIAQNEQLKKRSLDCSNERFGLKKGGYLLSCIALFETVYHRCMGGTHILKTSQNKKSTPEE